MDKNPIINNPELSASILETSFTAIVVFDSLGNFVFANDLAESIIGLPAKSIVKLRYDSPDWQLTDHDGIAFSEGQNPFEIVLRTRKSLYDSPLSFVSPDGFRKYLLVNTSPVKNQKGEIQYLVANLRDITKDLEIQSELKKQRDELQLILDKVPAQIFYKDTKNNIIRVNQGVADSKGVTPQEMADTTSQQWYPDLHEKYYKDDLEVIHSKKPKIGIIEPQTVKDGKIWIRMDKYPQFDADGNVVSLILFAQDITKEKLGEEQIQKTADLFRSIFENAGTGVVTNSPDGGFLNMNDAFCRFVGYTKEELLEMKVIDITHPDDKPYTKEIFKKLKLGIVIPPVDVEKRYIKKNGEVVWGRVTANWLSDKDGKATYGVGTIQDITSRKIAEEQLLQSENRFHGFFEKAAFGMAVYTIDGKIFEVNDSMCHMMGYSQKELLEMTLYDLTSSEYVKRSKEFYKTVREKKLKSSSYEKRYVRKDGRVFWGHVIANWVFDQNGDPLYGIAMVQDIDFKKISDSAIKDLHAELEQRIEDRTHELEQKNVALNEVLKQIEIEKRLIQRNILSNIGELIMPILKKMRRKGTKLDLNYVDMLEKSLEELTSSFGHRLSTQKMKLTPKEIEICGLIKAGLSTKEISNILNLSARTIENHRNNIRNKLGLSNQNVNLSTYLKSF